MVYGSLSGKGSAWGGRLWRFGTDWTVSWFEVCSDWFWFKSKVQTWSSLEYIYSSPCSFSVSQNSCGCLPRKAQQVSWLHSVVLRLKFLCLSLISAVMSIKCPICQLLFVVVVLVNCFLRLFLLPLFSAVFVSSVTSLHRLINHKALYLLYLVDRNQAREKWSHGFFHLGLRAMSIIKSQNA